MVQKDWTLKNTGLPKVSIIIPAFNTEGFIISAIESVLNQSWQNIELVIVNDGSTDNTQEIIDYFVGKFPGKVISVIQRNLGAAAARNAGLKIASGQYIQFLDADDILPADKIEKQLKILEKNPDCIVGCRWIRFRQSVSNTIGTEGPHESITKDMSPLEWLLQYHTMLIHAWLTPRDLIDRSGPWREDLSYNDDGEFMYRVIRQCRKVLYCPDTLVYYRTEQMATISNIYYQHKIKLRSFFESVFSYTKILLELEDSSRTREKVVKILQEAFCEFYPLSIPFKKQINRKIQELGGSKYVYHGSTRKEKLLIPIIGWKTVKITKHLIRQLTL